MKERPNLPDEQYNKLLESVFLIIKENGPRHTSMDLVASRLGMSKRTLYEIFDSKDQMLREVLERQHVIVSGDMIRLLAESNNVLEGIVSIIAYQQAFFNGLNPDFFRDMDTTYKHFRSEYDRHERKHNRVFSRIIETGQQQGLIRRDIDFPLQFTLLQVQMESLKRMEENFPPGISLLQAYNAIAHSFLRSIVTLEGLEELERLESKK